MIQKIVFGFLSFALASMATLAQGSDLAVKFESRMQTDVPAKVFLAVPEDLCASKKAVVINEQYSVGDKEQAFSTSKQNDYFILFKQEGVGTYLYRFQKNDDSIAFKSGYFRKLGNFIKVHPISTRNAPSYEYTKLHQIHKVTITHHAEVPDRTTNVVCPASIRSMVQKFYDLKIQSSPTGAVVSIDGNKLNFLTDEIIRIPAKESKVLVSLNKLGYLPHNQIVTGNETISATLMKR